MALARLAGVVARARAPEGLARGIHGRSSRGAKRGAVVNQVARGRYASAQCVPCVLARRTVFEVETTPFHHGGGRFFLGEGSLGGWRQLHALQVVARVIGNLSSNCGRYKGENALRIYASGTFFWLRASFKFPDLHKKLFLFFLRKLNLRQEANENLFDRNGRERSIQHRACGSCYRYISTNVVAEFTDL